ncbi:MAG TPA: hypothetical protein VJR89_12375 [Polyangiales bacterium]|nr:hypothetical protein [Polyangiales bacterium]
MLLGTLAALLGGCSNVTADSSAAPERGFVVAPDGSAEVDASSEQFDAEAADAAPQVVQPYADATSNRAGTPPAAAPEPKPQPSAAAPAAKPSMPPLANPAPGSKFFVGANFWNIGWQGRGDYFTSSPSFAATTNPWRQDFVRDLAPYHVLRFMDWNLTNTSNNAQARWNTRLKKTDDQRNSVALEWQIDLCNRARTDCWITVPHESEPDYWKQLAALVHDTLDPSLRIYVEWSNEVWNEQFPQRGYARSRGEALQLPGSDKAASYYVYQSVRVFEAFEAELGKDSPRLVKILAGQAEWSGPCETHLTALADAKINPNRTRATAYAIAPYVKGASSSAIRASIGKVRQWVADNAACARKAELPLISYEGGPDSFGSDDGQACQKLQHDPAMRGVYTSFLDVMYDAKLLGPFMQYTHSGACWGLKQSTSDTLANAPKYQALLDWVAAHP